MEGFRRPYSYARRGSSSSATTHQGAHYHVRGGLLLTIVQQSNIPSRFVGEQRVSDSPETAFLASFLHAILHPADDRALHAVLQSPVYHVPPADVSTLTAMNVRTRKGLRALFEDVCSSTATPGLSSEGLSGVRVLLADLVKCVLCSF